MQGILLAAGFGRRFQTDAAFQADKLLAYLPDQNQPILWQSAKVLIEALPNSIAVVQPQQIERKEILQALDFSIVESTNAEQGMGYAIADAVNASKNADGWLIALADMPWISTTLIQKMAASLSNPKSIIAPRFNGKRGQPVVFGHDWFDELSALQGDIGAREILKMATIDWIDWFDASIHQDVDTVMDMNEKEPN
jgi:molybdenum cofactor cytidylyltransferase